MKIIYPAERRFFCFYRPMQLDKALKHLKKKFVSNQGSGLVGVFDSGVGGLTSIPGLMKNGYKEIHYIGDNANFPYGEKDESTLSVIILERINDLLDVGVEKICIACNTASINFARIDKNDILGSYITRTISCTAAEVNSHYSFKRIGLIGTKYTVLTNAYYHAINESSDDENRVLIQSAEQELVQYIERGETDKQENEVRRISRYFNSLNVDAFILGCTHYSHVKEIFKLYLNENISIIDPSELLSTSMSTTEIRNIDTKLNVLFTANEPPFVQNFISL